MIDQAEGLRQAMREAGVTIPEYRHQPDKSQLWDGLRDDLSRWTLTGGFDKPNLSDEALAEFYELVQRREEQA